MQKLIVTILVAVTMLAALSACTTYTPETDSCHDCSVEAPPQFPPAPSK